jgi:hypothetical protein
MAKKSGAAVSEAGITKERVSKTETSLSFWFLHAGEGFQCLSKLCLESRSHWLDLFRVSSGMFQSGSHSLS